jgi:hypothetical protein
MYVGASGAEYHNDYFLKEIPHVNYETENTYVSSFAVLTTIPHEPVGCLLAAYWREAQFTTRFARDGVRNDLETLQSP